MRSGRIGVNTASTIASITDRKNLFLYGFANWNTLLKRTKSKNFLSGFANRVHLKKSTNLRNTILC